MEAALAAGDGGLLDGSAGPPSCGAFAKPARRASKAPLERRWPRLDSLAMAGSYLARSDFCDEPVAFLLGYEDPSSFFRAFRAWTGRTPEASRALASR